MVQAKRLGQRLESYSAFAQQAAGLVQGAAANKQANLELCRKFKAMKAAPAHAGVDHLLAVLKNPNAQTFWCQKAEDIAKVKAAAQAAAAACASNPDIAKLPDKGCSQIAMAENPGSWCLAATKAPDLLRQAVSNYLAHEVEVEMARKNIAKPEEVERHDGFTNFEGPVEWKKDLVFSDKALDDFRSRYAKILEAAGIKELDPAFVARLSEMRDKLRETVERLAPQWKLPESGGKHYGVPLAEKKIKSWHPKAKILKAFIGSADWIITKNAVDLPKYRDRSGYILFELPGEKYCQLRTFMVSEDYQGGGKFQPAGDVRIGSVRFQNCK